MADADAPTVPPLATRRPTGKPPWPMIVLAGGEKSGKSWAAAEFSASELVDRTFWLELGEGAADQYGALPGARYEIIEHDGSYRSIRRELWAATQQPRENGKPHAIVVDPVTALWNMLSDEAQYIANDRARRAADKQRRMPPPGDVVVGPDLWNNAKKRWARVIDLLRRYDGPVLLIARLELTVLMGKDGKPTGEKTWTIKAEKNLGHEADAIVRFTAPRTAELTGVRSTILRMEPDTALALPGFTVDGLLRRLGLDQAEATGPRVYVAPAPNWREAQSDMDAETAPQRPASRRPQQRSVQGPASPPKGWTAQMADQLAADFLIALQGAPTQQDLARIADEIKSAVRLGKITPGDRKDLLLTYEELQKRDRAADQEPVGAAA